MTKLRPYLFGAVAACAGGMCVIAARYWGPWYSGGATLTFVPQSIEIAEDPCEGNAIPVHLELHNRSSHIVTITSVRSSCGCTTLLGRDKSTLEVPFDLVPGESMPIESTVDTKQRMGPLTVAVVAEGTTQGRAYQAAATIRANIRAAWRLSPPHLAFEDLVPEATVRTDFTVLDGFPGAGLALKDITCSDPAQMSVSWRASNGSTSPPDAASRTLVSRYVATVEYRPRVSDRPVIYEWIELVGGDKAGDVRLRVPISCRYRAPDCVAVPRSLTIPRQWDGKSIVRKVQLLAARSDFGEVRIESCPPNAEVSIDDVDARKKLVVITFRAPLPGDQGACESQVNLTARLGSELEEVSIPIRCTSTQDAVAPQSFENMPRNVNDAGNPTSAS